MKTITNFFVLQAHSPLLKEIECTYTQRLLRFVTARSGTGGIIICVLEGDPCSHTSLVFLLPMPSIKVSFFSFSFCKDSLKKAHGHHVLSALSKQRSEHAQQQRLPGERLNINKRTSLLTKLHGSLVLPRGGDAQLCNPHSRVALNSFAVEPSRTAASAAGSSAESGANAPVHVPSSFFFFFFPGEGKAPTRRATRKCPAIGRTRGHSPPRAPIAVRVPDDVACATNVGGRYASFQSGLRMSAGAFVSQGNVVQQPTPADEVAGEGRRNVTEPVPGSRPSKRGPVAISHASVAVQQRQQPRNA